MTDQHWLTWTRNGWVSKDQALSFLHSPVVTGPNDCCPDPATTMPLLTEDEEEQCSRRLKALREAMGLDLSEAAALCDLHPRTLKRAEDDPDYTPQKATREKLRWVFGETAFEQTGFHIVDAVQQDAEDAEQVCTRAVKRLAKAVSAPYRRKAVGATAVLTRAALGDPQAFLLLSECLGRVYRAERPDPALDSLSSEDERELGFPERQFGQVLQRTGGAFQRFARAATAYAETVLAGADPRQASQLCLAVWDALDDLCADDLHALSATLTLPAVRRELLVHLTGWTAIQEPRPGASRSAEAEWYLQTVGTKRPTIAGDLWQALGVWEDDPAWPQAVAHWRGRHDEVGDSPAQPALDEGLLWACALPADCVSEMLGIDLDTITSRAQILLTRSRAEIFRALRKAAQWAILEAGDQPTANPLRRFYRKVIVTCGGKGKIKGLGLDVRTVAEMLDLHEIFLDAVVARQRETSLWRAVHDWIAQPCRGPQEAGEAGALAQALLSLLPDPPIAQKARLDHAAATTLVQVLAPLFFSEGAQPERFRRFTLGAIRQWKRQRDQPLPIQMLETRRQREFVQGARAALAGRGEASTAGRMARAVYASLPRAIATPGLQLPTATVQERLQKGLPYFFPRKTASDAVAIAQRIVCATRHRADA